MMMYNYGKHQHYTRECRWICMFCYIYYTNVSSHTNSTCLVYTATCVLWSPKCCMICISHGFPGEMEFSPTSSPYPAQSRVAARAGFGDEWEKTHLSWKSMWNAFSPMLHHLFCRNKPICNNNKPTAVAILNMVSTHNIFQIVKHE